MLYEHVDSIDQFRENAICVELTKLWSECFPTYSGLPSFVSSGSRLYKVYTDS